MRRRKQWLAVLLAVTMAGSMMPTTVRAAEAENLTAEQKNETEENKEPEEKAEESKEQTEESEEEKASTEAKQDSEKEDTSEEVTGEPKEEAKEELSGETSKEGTPQESMDEKKTSTEETQAPTESEEKPTQEHEDSSTAITEEEISEESSVDVIADGQQETTETTDETTEEQTPEEELKAMIEALPKLEDVDTTDEEQMEALLEQLNAIADFAEEHDIDVSENETLLALMELFQEPMMVDDQADGNYKPVTGNNEESLSADKAVTNFTFDSGINSDVTVSNEAVFVEAPQNLKGTKVAAASDSLTVGDSRIIKIPGGFKYYNGNTYDVYVKITSNHKLTNINWVCENRGIGYYTISPGTSNGTSFDYEIWLQDGNTTVTDIDLVAGSCYTAETEGARPWSDDGKIYTNATLSNLKWYDSVTSGSSNINSFWSPYNNNDNSSNKYILGHGTDSNHHVKGGYIRKSGTGGAEMVLGYLVNTANFNNATEDTDKADALSFSTQKVPTDKLVVPPRINVKTGYYFAYWTADKAVTLSNGDTIAKGGHITQEQLAAVKATKTGFDGIHFTAHYVAYDSAVSSDGTTYYLTTGSGADTAKVKTVIVGEETVTPDVKIEAIDMEYTGSAYTESNVTVSGLENLEKVYLGALQGTVEYYLAGEDGNITGNKTTQDNSGAATEGAAPVKVGTYYAKVKIISTAGEQYIYDKFEITPLQAKATVTANTGLTYDGTEHELVTTTSVSGGTVKYSVDGGTNWTTEIPKKKDAGSYEVWYYVEPDDDHTAQGSKEEPMKVSVTIAKKAAKVSVKADNKIYDGSKDATVTVAGYEGILDADQGKFTVDGMTGTFADANVGNDKTVTVDSSKKVMKGDITTANNYDITVQETTTANITKASQDAPAITGENAVTPEAETIDGKNDGKLTKLTDKMEYRLKGTETYTSVPAGETSVSDLPDGVYEIRYKADDNHTASPAAEVTVGQGRKLTITVNPSAESGQQTGYALTTSESTQSWHGGYEITFTLDKGYIMGSDFKVMVNNEEISLHDSENRTYTACVTDMEKDHVVTIKGVEVAPKATAKVAAKENTYDGTEQKLIDTTDVTGGKVWYSVDGGKTWSTDIPTGKDAGNYEVWYYVEPDDDHTAQGSKEEPMKVSVTIAKKAAKVSVKADNKIYDGSKDATVTVAGYEGILDADQGKFTVDGMTGTFADANVGNDKTVTVDSSKKVMKGDITTANNYDITVQETTTANITKASQDAPAITGENAVTPEAETIDGKNDGKLTKLTDKMEYRLKGTETYTSVPAGETSVSDLPDGVYEIRYKADDNHTASPAAEVTVGQGRKLTITVNPSAESGQQIGYALTTSESTQSWHGGYKVTFTLNKGYKMTSDFAVMVNGEKINLTKNEDGTYTFDVTDMEENHVVTLQGVSKNSKKHKHSSSQDESDTTVSPSSSATLTASPQTGDSNMPFFWSIMTMLSAVILAGAGILFRRRKIK